jgi:hypothetical protein
MASRDDVCARCDKQLKYSRDFAPGEVFVWCSRCNDVWLLPFPDFRVRLEGDFARKLLDNKAYVLKKQWEHDMLNSDWSDPRWQRCW